MAKVLVTGATGFIAGHTILKLLEDGYEIRGTARSADRKAALMKTLSDYAGKPIDFEVVAANLSSDDGWAEAAQGMDYVQHLASPIPNNVPKDPNELIKPARDGAIRVLKAAKADGNIKRVVMTSSMASIAYGHGKNLPETLSEEIWSNPDNLKDNTAYTRSKTIAERAAWDYVNGDGADLELTTINPVAVLGPVMSGDFSASLEILTQPLMGKLPAVPNVGFQVVDVRDVADAHVKAMTKPEAAGERIMVGTDFMWFMDVIDVLREAYPDRKLPKSSMPNFAVKLASNLNKPLKQIICELGKRRYATNEKAKRLLDWQPRTAKEAVLAGAESLIKAGAV